jgi:hypothetical protein
MDTLAIYILGALAVLMIALGAMSVALGFIGRHKGKRSRPF